MCYIISSFYSPFLSYDTRSLAFKEMIFNNGLFNIYFLQSSINLFDKIESHIEIELERKGEYGVLDNI